MSHPQISKRAHYALTVIARFETGQYRLNEFLTVSSRLWNILVNAGLVEREVTTRAYAGNPGRVHLITEAGWDAVGDAVDTH